MSFDALGTERTARIAVDIPGAQALALRVTVSIGLDEGVFYVKGTKRLNRRTLLLRIREALNPSNTLWDGGCARFEEPLRGPTTLRGDPLSERVPPADREEWDILDHLLNELRIKGRIREQRVQENLDARKARREEAKARREEAVQADRERRKQVKVEAARMRQNAKADQKIAKKAPRRNGRAELIAKLEQEQNR